MTAMGTRLMWDARQAAEWDRYSDGSGRSQRKREIIQRGIELGAPLDRTWSCYQFDDEACGSCDSCRLRLKAFMEAGVTDPIAYRARVER